MLTASALLSLLWAGAATTAYATGFGFHTVGDSGNGNWGWSGEAAKNYINGGESAGVSGLEQTNWYNVGGVGYNGEYDYSFCDDAAARSTASVHISTYKVCTGSRSTMYGYVLPDPLTAQAKLFNGMAWFYDTTMTITLPAGYQQDGYDVYLIGNGDYSIQLGSGAASSVTTGSSVTTPAIVKGISEGYSNTVTITGFNGGGKNPGDAPNKLFSGFQIVRLRRSLGGAILIVR